MQTRAERLVDRAQIITDNLTQLAIRGTGRDSDPQLNWADLRAITLKLEKLHADVAAFEKREHTRYTQGLADGTWPPPEVGVVGADA